MSGVRQAALILHGLTTEDREWVLSHFVEDRVEQLRGLLAELHGLGIPADPALIRHAVQRSSVTSVGSAANDIATLASASADQMHSLLIDEPERLIGLLLSTSAWPWKESFLALQTPDRAERVCDLALTLAAGTLMRNAIVSELVMQLSNAPRNGVSVDARSPGRGWRGLYRRLSQGWNPWGR